MNFAGILDAVWQANEDILVYMKSTSLAIQDTRTRVARLLEEELNLDGHSKLFVVACSLQCMQEILQQVCSLSSTFLFQSSISGTRLMLDQKICNFKSQAGLSSGSRGP